MKFLGVKYKIILSSDGWWVNIGGFSESRLGLPTYSKNEILNMIKNEIVQNGSSPIGNPEYNQIYKPVWNKSAEGCGDDYYLRELPFIFSITRNKVVKTKWNFTAYKLEEGNATYIGSCFKVCDSLKEAKQNVFAAYKYLTYPYKVYNNG